MCDVQTVRIDVMCSGQPDGALRCCRSPLRQCWWGSITGSCGSRAGAVVRCTWLWSFDGDDIR